MNPPVKQAVEELRASFSDANVMVHATADGGGVVTIDPIDLGPAYTPQHTWLKFAISFQYPHADIYPLFVRPDLVRADGKAHGKGVALAEFEGRPALQLSRINHHLNPDIDTAALKVTKVIEWLRTE